jgi:GTP pyrophosphokinase
VRTTERLRAPLADELTKAGLAEFEITGRPKNLWSVYKKMKKRDMPFEEIYDLLAVRVLVATIPDCYHVLGAIHHAWTPLQERIKDYIASPKSNGYQSLHTTVFGPNGQLYEIQIRTRDMHRTAEYGIAAHWLYHFRITLVFVPHYLKTKRYIPATKAKGFGKGRKSK